MRSPLAPLPALNELLRSADKAARAAQPGAQFEALLASLDSAARPHAGCDRLLDFLLAHRPRARHADIDRVWRLALDEVWARPSALAAPLADYLALEPSLAAALIDPDRSVAAALEVMETEPLLHRLLALSPLPQARWEALLVAVVSQLLAGAETACQRYPRLLTALALWAQQTGRIALPATDAALRAAIQAGHAYVRARGAVSSPEVLFEARGPNGQQGIYGDSLTLAEGEAATLTTTVNGGIGQRLSYYANGLPVLTVPVLTDPFVHTLPATRLPAGEGPLGTFWRIEVRDAQSRTVIGNPIFLVPG